MGASAVTLTGDSTALFTGQLVAATRFTVRRIRGTITCFLESTLAAADECRVAFGIALVSSDAAVLGATAMPDPAGEPEFPWLWW